MTKVVSTTLDTQFLIATINLLRKRTFTNTHTHMITQTHIHKQISITQKEHKVIIQKSELQRYTQEIVNYTNTHTRAYNKQFYRKKMKNINLDLMKFIFFY